MVGDETIPVTFNLMLDYKNSFGGTVTLIDNNHDTPRQGFNNNSMFICLNVLNSGFMVVDDLLQQHNKTQG